MTTLKWFPEGFAGEDQKRILARLARLPKIRESFFLTGGTALAVFYLGHRTSEDLDLFTLETCDFSGLLEEIRKIWPSETTLRREDGSFLSFLIRSVKVDLVRDPYSHSGARPQATLGDTAGEAILAVDTVGNIASNKLATLISRTELKDYLDFFLISQTYPELDREKLFLEAREKDGMFDDAASAAFQIETGARQLRRRLSRETGELIPGQILYPGLIEYIGWADFWRFFDELTLWLYRKGIG